MKPRDQTDTCQAVQAFVGRNPQRDLDFKASDIVRPKALHGPDTPSSLPLLWEPACQNTGILQRPGKSQPPPITLNFNLSVTKYGPEDSDLR